mmetsp:Transcript_159401/g.511423  ORF Transcript_159401/g.511423 Transcript_159401/m.511423 type:complete len:229 (+) Transcript_159401:1003-1689(+)
MFLPEGEKFVQSSAGPLQLLVATMVQTNGIQEMICRVEVLRYGKSCRGKKAVALWACRSTIDDTAIGQEHDLIQDLVDAAPRLMDAHHDCVALLGQTLERLHDTHRLEAVQARCGLVHKDQTRLVEQLATDVDTLPLTTRHPSLARHVTANDRVRDRCQTKLRQCPLHTRVSIRSVGQAQSCNHRQGLTHRGKREQCIVLLHICNHGWQVEGGNRHQCLTKGTNADFA